MLDLVQWLNPSFFFSFRRPRMLFFVLSPDHQNPHTLNDRTMVRVCAKAGGRERDVLLNRIVPKTASRAQKS